MLNWFSDFFSARQVLFEPGARKKVGTELRAWGVNGSSAFIVADPIVSSLGMLDALVEGLTEAGINSTVYTGISGEPTSEMLEAALEVARDEKAEMIIGIGGGSALDTAKVIDYVLSTGAPLSEVHGPVAPAENLLPLVLIPTTTGTGSEATRISMYSEAGVKRAVANRQLLPTIAVLDPELVENLPARVVASTALDALSHAIESMLSTQYNDLTTLVAGEAARTIFAELRAAVHDGSKEAKAKLLYASYLGGMSLNAGVVLGHSISYVVASRLHLSHGDGCALALPYCMTYNASMDPERLRQIALLVTGGASADFKQLTMDVRALVDDIGLASSLQQLDGETGTADELAQETIENFPRPNNPVPFEQDRLRALYEAVATGNLEQLWAELNVSEENA